MVSSTRSIEVVRSNRNLYIFSLQGLTFSADDYSVLRMHYLTFPHKYLDKHYENLLLCEPRFFELSKQSFPTLKNPFFHSNSCGNPGSAFDYNHRGQDFNLRMQFNFPNFPSHVGQTQHIQPYGHIGQTQHVQPYGHNDQAQHKQPYGHKGLSSLKEMPTPASGSVLLPNHIFCIRF